MLIHKPGVKLLCIVIWWGKISLFSFLYLFLLLLKFVRVNIEFLLFLYPHSTGRGGILFYLTCFIKLEGEILFYFIFISLTKLVVWFLQLMFWFIKLEGGGDLFILFYFISSTKFESGNFYNWIWIFLNNSLYLILDKQIYWLFM